MFQKIGDGPINVAPSKRKQGVCCDLVLYVHEKEEL
jgi:hypothetical protein